MHTPHVRLWIGHHTSILWQCNTVLEDVVTCVTEEVNCQLDGIIEEVSIDTDVQFLSNLPLQVISTCLLLNDTLSVITPCRSCVVINNGQVRETSICDIIVTSQTV